MNTIAVKFGGSSLASASQMQKAAAIVRADSARRYVVVSAPGKRSSDDTKVTDLLYRCCDLAAAGGEFAPVLDQIRARFADIVAELGLDLDLAPALDAIAAHLRTAPRRDYMASRGEYLNARIFAACLGYDFLDTADLIRFDEHGHLLEAETDALLRAALAGTERAVLPGFYGAQADGTVRTFSRGGSDVTGALVARAADAALYENWTDVSGMLFTDPRIVDAPRTIDYISYRELRELSYMGASVLHEDAVFPVRKAGIPINIRNTNAPEDAGTMIVPVLPEGLARRTVTGVAGRMGFTSVIVEKPMMNSEVGFGCRLLEIFAQCGVPFEHCPTGIDTMSVVVSTALFDAHRDAILERIRRELQPELITVERGLAMIAVVGQGMVYAKGSAAKVCQALADAGVNIRMLDQGSSELNIILGVEEQDFNAAIRAIYRLCTDEFAVDKREMLC